MVHWKTIIVHYSCVQFWFGFDINIYNFRIYFLGDSCETKSGLYGTCKIIADCPSALSDYVNKGIFPSDICGYRRTQQSIICCAERSTGVSGSAVGERAKASKW